MFLDHIFDFGIVESGRKLSNGPLSLEELTELVLDKEQNFANLSMGHLRGQLHCVSSFR